MLCHIIYVWFISQVDMFVNYNIFKFHVTTRKKKLNQRHCTDIRYKSVCVFGSNNKNVAW